METRSVRSPLGDYSFLMRVPAPAGGYNPTPRSQLALSRGTRLGPFEITALLAVGGMGEGYRARDTNLKWDVAIKVLPSITKKPILCPSMRLEIDEQDDQRV